MSLRAQSLRAQVEDFLFHEAALLDAWRLEEWAALFAEAGVYLVPAPAAPDADAGPPQVLIRPEPFTPGAAASRSPISVEAASRCSKLSRMSRTRLSLRWSAMVSRMSRPGASGRPRARAIVGMTRVLSCSAARATANTPCGR